MQASADRQRIQTAAAAASAAALALAALLVLVRHSSPSPAAPFVPDVPGEAQARKWLAGHYAEQQQRGAAPRWPAAVSLPGCEQPGAVPNHQASAEEQQLRRADQEDRTAERHKSHIVLATVGDGWGPGAGQNGWLDDVAAADFDLVAVYFGTNASWECPQCLLTIRGLRGPK